jgi:hypothetical protein
MERAHAFIVAKRISAEVSTMGQLRGIGNGEWGLFLSQVSKPWTIGKAMKSRMGSPETQGPGRKRTAMVFLV